MNTPHALSDKNLEIIELLGEGGSGAVYRAHQAVLDREVAVKVILPAYANHPDFIRSFELEAQTIARLEHPHIVPLYDFWRDPQGAYIVMRYLRAGSLKKRLSSSPLSLSQIDTLLDQLTSALAAAHRNSVIHRDLKPDNILLDEDGNAYLSDFGIARITGHSPTEENISGTLAYIAPEQLLANPASPSMDIYSLGFILFELVTGQHPFPGLSAGQLVQVHISQTIPDLKLVKSDLPGGLNHIIQKATAKKPEQRYETIRELWREFHLAVTRGESVVIEAEPVERRNPYKGLRPFDEAEAGDFFGREALTALLLRRMAEVSPYRNFLAVVGASGSGKSSLIRAGLLPQIRNGNIPGSETWFICEMLPGTNPLAALAQALLSVAPGAPPRLEDQLRSDPQALLWAVDNMMAQVNGDLLLFIDQFEELFTVLQDEAERAHFLELLRHAISAEHSRFRVILTLRADFYDRPLLYEGFGEVMQQRTQVVLSLNAAEIERAITGPAQRVGVQVNSDLVAAIVADMREEPGALPLLQYALTEVFERCEGSSLVLDAYLESGGVEGALARRAEDVYQSLSESEQETAQQVFLRLVALGDQAADTRRRSTQSELFSASSASRNEVEKVLAKFGDYRLLAFDRDSITREPTIEIAHEALIRGWERLNNWLDASRDDLQIQRQLAQLVQQWFRAGRDESYLLRGSRLIQFKAWAQNTRLKLSPEETDLLDTSIRLEDDESRARQEAQREKERLTLRTQSQQRLLIVGLIIGVLIAGMLSIVAIIQGSNARVEADQNATAQFVAEEARATSEANTAELRLAVDEIRSLNMADAGLQALQTGDIDSAITMAYTANLIDGAPIQAQRALTTIAGSVGTWKRLEGHQRDVQALAFSPDGQEIVSGSFDQTLILWDIATGTMLRQMQGHDAVVLAVDFSPDGRYLVSGDANGVILLWDAASGEILRRFEGHLDNIHGITFSPNGQQVASASADGMVILWDTESAAIIHRLTGHLAAVLAVDYSADAPRIVSGAVNGSLIVWDVVTGQELLEVEDDAGPINAVAFRPNQAQFVSAGNDGILKLWDSETGALLQQFSGHDGAVLTADFSPDSQKMISGGADNTLRLWDLAAGRLSRVYNGHSGRVRAAAFSPDGHLIASASADDSLRLWLTQPLPLDQAISLSGHLDNVKQARFSPDGSLILSGAGKLFDPDPLDKRLFLWDWRTGRILRSYDAHEDSITAVAWSLDGQTGLSASRDHDLILWDLQTGEALRRLQGHSDWVWSVVFSPDGQTALSASRDHSLILWNVQNGEPLRRFEGHAEWVNAGVFSADAQQIVSGADDAKVILWETQTGNMIREYQGHEGPVHDVAISPDASTIFSGSSDWSAIVWDTATGDILQRFFDEQGAVNAVAYSPDGQTLVYGTGDGSLILRDTTSGETRQSFQAAGEIVRSVSFSPDARWLLASFDSGLIRVYPLSRQVVMDWIAANVYLRPFDCAEKQRFAIEPLCPPEDL